jgi:UDP-3-O-[3-hydroxymyristoyl] glucosamine N-acyltransferase
MPDGYRLGDLAARVGGRVVGDPERRIRGVAALEDAGPEDLAFLTNPKYREAAAATRAGAVLVPPGATLAGHDILETPEPYLALAEILDLLHPPRPRRPGISPLAFVAAAELGEDVEVGPFAVIGEGVRLGRRATVGAGAVLGEGAEVGDDTVIHPRVVLYPGTRVGSRCILHAGVVLGGDGFGFATSSGRHRKVPQLGRVVVEDDVEIGANSAVDRGTLGDTIIGRGTKIDDLVMVAHGVRIGPHGLMAGQSGIAGSTRVGSHVTFAGQAGAAGHLTIGDGSVVAAKSAVFDDLPERSFVAGIPAVHHLAWKRTQLLCRRLPELRSRIRALEARLRALEGKGREGD